MIFFPIWLLQPPSPQEWGRGGVRGLMAPSHFFWNRILPGMFSWKFSFVSFSKPSKTFLAPAFPKSRRGLCVAAATLKTFRYWGVFGKLFRFSENLARFVYLKHPCWDSTFCLITDELCFEIISNIKFWKSWYFEYTKLKLRHGSFPGRFSTWLAEKMAERCIGYSIVSAWIKCKIISPLMTSIEMCLLSTRSLNDITINNTSKINVEF